MNKRQHFLLLTKYAEAFYNTSKKLITDEEYDKLKDDYESKYNERFTIGAKVKVEQSVNLLHSYKNLAGTLDKINSINEFINWSKLKNSNDYYVSYKIDGNSLILEYEDGILTKALTRGEEGVGKDLTSYFKTAKLANGKSIAKIDKLKGMSVGIATECCVLYSDFEEMIEDGAEYNNPRSAVPGILSEDGISLSEYLTLIPFKLIIKDKPSNRSYENQLLIKIQSYFSKADFGFTRVNTLKDIEAIYNSTIKNRFELPFMIDGLVIECADEPLRNKLGYTDNRPNFAIALKLPYIEAKTKITDLKWFTEGNSARYTPVVYFEPVVINRNTYRKVSLSNLKRVNNLKPFIGQEAIFTLRGDVLGYIDPIDNESVDNIPFNIISHCQFCKQPLSVTKTNTFIYCDNTDCELVVLGTLQNFLEKHNIKGIKRSTLKSLYDAKLLNNIEGLFNLDYKKISSLPGFGVKSANIIKEALTYFDEPCWDYKILGSFNIPYFSTRRAQQVLQCIGFEEFIELICKDDSSYLTARLIKFKGFKEKITKHIYNGFTNANLELLAFLTESLEIKYTKTDEENYDNEVVSLNICVTGSLNYFKTRKDLEQKILDSGHKLVTKVTHTTDILMTNDPNTDTDKNKAAKKLNTKVLSELDLINYLKLEV